MFVCSLILILGVEGSPHFNYLMGIKWSNILACGDIYVYECVLSFTYDTIIIYNYDNDKSIGISSSERSVNTSLHGALVICNSGLIMAS